MQPQNIESSINVQDKIRGALWGAVLGDVIGAHLQFARNIDEKKIKDAFIIKGGGVHKLEPGQPTDDSELGYSIGRGLVRGKGQLNLNLIAEQMGNWFLSKPIDVGGTIRKSIPKACNMKVHQAHLCRKGANQGSQQSQSNGSLMSITPLAVWCHKLKPEDIIKAVQQYTMLIHPNKLVILSNIFYTLMLTFFLKTQNLGEQSKMHSFQYAKTQIKQKYAQCKEREEFLIWIHDIQEAFKSIENLEEKVSPVKSSGWVRVALSYAIYYLIKGTSFKQSLFDVMKLKGDTDTNACIAGGLMGAYYGLSKLDLAQQIEKIKQWRPKKVKRPEWLVPGIVVQNFSRVLLQISPTSLKIVGGSKEEK